MLCSTFCWWELYFVYFDQKLTLICAITLVTLVGFTVLFQHFYLYISLCYYTYTSFISCSFFLQLYIIPFCNYVPLCLGIHEYYSQYSIYVSDRLHKTFLSLQALGKKNVLNPFGPYQRFPYQEIKKRYSSFTYRVTFERTKQAVADSRHVVVL